MGSLGEHGVSDHVLLVSQCMYYGQTGRIENNSADGDLFYIKGACDKDVYSVRGCFRVFWN